MTIQTTETPNGTMTHAEAVMLCRYTKACCPQQQIDQYTPDAWFDLLGDLRFKACKEAIAEVAKRQPFVSPAEIREQVSMTRRKRLEDFKRDFIFEAPAYIREIDPAHSDEAWFAWEQGWKKAVMDGDVTHVDQIEHSKGLVRGTPPPPPEVKALVDRIRANVVRRPTTPAPAPLLDPSDHTREPTPPAPDETTDQPKEGAA